MKMTKQTAYVWRESIYKNNFRCKCGTILAKPDGEPLGDTLYETQQKLIICPTCGNVAAVVKEIEVAIPMTGKQGYWGDITDEPLFKEQDDD